MRCCQGGIALNTAFADTLRKMREERGISQVQLGKKMFVNHSTVARSKILNSLIRIYSYINSIPSAGANTINFGTRHMITSLII